MPVAKSLKPPEWIRSGAEITGGLDLLGLRLPVQFIGGTLLDGVTTVTLTGLVDRDVDPELGPGLQTALEHDLESLAHLLEGDR